MSQQFITKGVPKLEKAEDVSVCLTPAFKQTCLSVVRDGHCELLLISKRVAAELIAAGFAYQG